MSPDESVVAATSALGEITFGSIAGMTAKVFEHPFDLIKVRLQSQPTDRPPTFTGPWDCFRQTYAKEGWKGLYRGLSAPVIGAACENATLFLCYSKCQDLIISLNPLGTHTTSGVSDKILGKRRELTMPELALAAAGAGSVTSFVLTPIELVKCRMQVQMLAREGAFGFGPGPAAAASGIAAKVPSITTGTNATTRSIHTSPSLLRPLQTPSPVLPPPQGPFSIILSTLRTSGLRGLWLGQTGTLFRETGGSAAWFSAYELCARSFMARRQRYTSSTITKKDLASHELMLSGAAAGVSYNVVLFPADSIKSAMQTWAELNPNQPRLGFGAMASRIWKTRGLKGMYAGCGVTVLRSAPSSAMIFLIYETLSQKYGYILD